MANEAARKTGDAVIICDGPDVCLTPVGSSVVPIPYFITSKLDGAYGVEPTVKLTGMETYTHASRTPKVKGNEAGTKGGIKSGKNVSICKPVAGVHSIKVGGHLLLCHGQKYDMNCSSDNGIGNVLGTLTYTP